MTKKKGPSICPPGVSSLGRFRNTIGNVHTPKTRRDGYATVVMRRGGRQCSYVIHRLVADTFELPKRTPECIFIDHLDGSPSNNRLDNLEWVTARENNKRSHINNKQRGSNASRLVKPVRGRRLGATEWEVYPGGCNGAARALGLDAGPISACCRGRSKQTGGYEFEFAEPPEPLQLPGEEWRETVHGAFVSSLGRLRNTCGVVNTPKATSSGYVRVGIHKKSYNLHVLIAEAFQLTKRSECTQVDHIDGNPSNNRLDNLEWVTREENMRRSYIVNTARGTGTERVSKPVRGRKLGTVEWTLYESVSAAAASAGVSGGQVSSCCHGKYKQTQGYEFEFAEAREPAVLPGEEWRDVVFTDEVDAVPAAATVA